MQTYYEYRWIHYYIIDMCTPFNIKCTVVLLPVHYCTRICMIIDICIRLKFIHEVILKHNDTLTQALTHALTLVLSVWLRVKKQKA